LIQFVAEGSSIPRRAFDYYRQEGLRSLLSRVPSFAFDQYATSIARFVGEHIQPWPESVTLDRPVFVIGSSRSGTSVFTRCLEAHPDVAGWSEAGTVWDPNNYYNKDADHRFTAADSTKETRKRIRNTFLTYLKLSRKDRFLNKHPRNSLRIEFIREIFPDAMFVYMVRHPLGPIDSMVRRSQEGDRAAYPYGRFTKPPGWREDVDEPFLTQYAFSWRKINEYVLERRDSGFCTVGYEEFCASPREVLRLTCTSLGLDDSRYPATVPEDVSNMNDRSVDNMTESEIDCVWSIVGETADRFGYEKPTWF
jgi:hypothetical protein